MVLKVLLNKYKNINGIISSFKISRDKIFKKLINKFLMVVIMLFMLEVMVFIILFICDDWFWLNEVFRFFSCLFKVFLFWFSCFCWFSIVLNCVVNCCFLLSSGFVCLSLVKVSCLDKLWVVWIVVIWVFIFVSLILSFVVCWWFLICCLFNSESLLKMVCFLLLILVFSLVDRVEVLFVLLFIVLIFLFICLFCWFICLFKNIWLIRFVVSIIVGIKKWIKIRFVIILWCKLGK